MTAMMKAKIGLVQDSVITASEGINPWTSIKKTIGTLTALVTVTDVTYVASVPAQILYIYLYTQSHVYKHM